MKFFDRDIPFPGKLSLSFESLIQRMEEELKTAGKQRSQYLQSVLDEVAQYPELRNGLEYAESDRYDEQIQLLMEVIFPGPLSSNEIKCATAPWDFQPFYMSERLKGLLENNEGDFAFEFEGYDEEQLYISACSAILGMHYGMPINASRPFYVKLKDKNSGVIKHYRMAINADFMQMRPTEKAVKITQEDYHELIDNYTDIDLWKSKFPEGSWEFSGFTVLNLMDLTFDQQISEIEKDLLSGGPEGLKNLTAHMSELLGVHDLMISFVSMDGETLIQGGGLNFSTMMMGDCEESKASDLLCPYCYGELVENNRPIAFPDVERMASVAKAQVYHNLMLAGVKSYFAIPIEYNGERLGFLELGSKTKGLLNASLYVLLEQVIPVLAVSGNRYYQEKVNRIEAIIQEECTTIHPSVKWRFVEEAYKHLKAENIGEKHTFKDLAFKDVYPLFGQLDIRGSSVMRNEAVRSDVLAQLQAVNSILDKVRELNDLPIYEELQYVVNEHIHEVELGMNTRSEHAILGFLQKEIESLFPVMREKSDELESLVSAYEDKVDNEFHLLYQERKKFDVSVNQMNKLLASYLDEKQAEAQAMFPHYFERYKTDGVEFNMYIGQSIAPDKNFDYLLVKNLRIWQLMTMVEMEREFHSIKGQLEKSLDVASLILAYSTPLSIHFRMDEKRFDVDGAYNARYEIIKKRIDKAHIKGTDERITAPGRMVVIYNSEEIEQEYIRYFEFMQSKHYLTADDFEILQVEDLQGVSGLKAIRASIDFSARDTQKDVTMEELLAELEG